MATDKCPTLPTQVVAEFKDGSQWPIYDAKLSLKENCALADALAKEGRRRLAAGLSDSFHICKREAIPTGKAAREDEVSVC